MMITYKREFYIKIAEVLVKVRCIWDTVYEHCKDYIYEPQGDEQEDFLIESNPGRFEAIMAISKKAWEKKTNCEVVFTDGYLEDLQLHIMLGERLLEHDVLLVHGSAIEVDGEVYLFSASSGTGKSTHTALWRQYFGNRARMINDDKPALRVEGNKVLVYGTPWRGKARLGENASAPLKAIIFLTRDERNHIERMSAEEMLPVFLRYVHRGKSAEGMAAVLRMVSTILSNCELYKLGCNMDIDAAKVAYEGMN